MVWNLCWRAVEKFCCRGEVSRCSLWESQQGAKMVRTSKEIVDVEKVVGDFWKVG